MNRDLFASNAQFPACWLENGLLEDKFFVNQALAFEAEYGASKPTGGTEHWRFAAFLHWLRQDNDTGLLGYLLDAALADPDPPMAGNILKTIVAKPNCTRSMFEAALVSVTANAEYHVSPAELRRTFESRPE